MPKQTKFQPLEPIVPDRFREARLSRGMTANELAEKVGVSRQAISKYELGASEPSSQVMEAISNSLNMPIAFFHKPLSAPINRGTTFFRSLKTNAARAKEILSTKSVWAQEISSLLSKDIIYPAVNLPNLPVQYENYNEYPLDAIEEITAYLRSFWGIGEAPIPNLARLLESNGFVIACINTGFPETDACSAFIDNRPFIFLDSHKECAVRGRFDMAHELGHLILHGGISQADLDQKNTLDRVEREANRFASCFLLPKMSFMVDIRSTSLQSFLPLKKKWKVSIQAMVYRCRELEVFNESQMIYIQKQISAKRWRKNEPFDDIWPCEDASLLRTAVKMLIDRGDYTKDNLPSILRMCPSDIEELCSLPSGYLSLSEPEKTILVDFATKKVIK